MADLDENDVLKLIPLQTVVFLLRAFFFSLSKFATLAPAAKQNQLIVFIGRLAGRSHYDDLPSHLERLPYMEQRTLNSCVCFASVQVQALAACIYRFACADAWPRRLPPYLESPPVCDGPNTRF